MDRIKTAVSMFNAGAVLCEEFDKLNKGTEDIKARRRSLIIPIVIVYIFGIEMALKAMIKREGEDPGKIHDLLKLYKKLLPKTQKNINEKVSKIGINASDVQNVMEEYQNSLQEWRYMEDFDDSPLVDLRALQVTLCTIINIHTDRYGAEMKEEKQVSQNQTGVPPNIQGIMSEYQKNMFK